MANAERGRGSSLVEFARHKREMLLLGDSHHFNRQIESAAYEVIIKSTCSEPLGFCWQILRRNGQTEAIVHSGFYERNGQFIEDYLDARQAAHLVFDRMIDTFVGLGKGKLDHLDNLKGFVLPIVCVQVDDLSIASAALGIDEGVLGEGLRLVPYWKGSENLMWGCSVDPSHDLPSFIDSEAKEDGLKRSESMRLRAVHEMTHLITDDVTGRRFHTYATWYNEGVGNYFAQKIQRSRRRLKEERLTPTIKLILRDNNVFLKYFGGCLLVAAIGQAYDQQKPEAGIVEFTVKLFGDGSFATANIGETSLEILERNGRLAQVKEVLQRLAS